MGSFTIVCHHWRSVSITFFFGRQYKMGRYTCSDLPPSQDSPPPRSSSHSQDKRAAGAKCSLQNVTSRQPFKKLHFSNELEVTEHEVFTKDGRERVCGWSGNNRLLGQCMHYRGKQAPSLCLCISVCLSDVGKKP